MDERIKSHLIAKKIIERSQKHHLPVVVVDGHYDNVSCANFDYESGFEKVVRHVIEYHKVSHPHMMAGLPDNEFSDNRIEVFKKVLAENNMPFDDSFNITQALKEADEKMYVIKKRRKDKHNYSNL